MQKIYTGKQLRALYRQAEVYDHLSAEDHIERAARSFEQEFRRLYTQTGYTIYIFAGAGRCGAYALRIASYMAQRGYAIMAYLFYREGKLSDECEAIRRSISDGDLRLEEVYRNFTPPRIKEQDVIIDGLFGTELTTPLFGGYVGLVDFLNASKASIVSLELPSGLFAEDNSGNNLDHIIKAKYTISFDCPYLAFFFEENKPFIGQWSYLPLGISPQAQDELDATYYLTEDASLTSALRLPPIHPEGKVLFEGTAEELAENEWESARRSLGRDIDAELGGIEAVFDLLELADLLPDSYLTEVRERLSGDRAAPPIPTSPTEATA